MKKKKLTVRGLIKKLLEFNMDAKIEININGVPFYLNSDFSLCWSIYDGDSYKERLKDKQTTNNIMFDFTAPERC